MGLHRQVQVQLLTFPSTLTCINTQRSECAPPPPQMMLSPPLRSSTICNLRQVFKPLPAPMWCFDDSRPALTSSCSHLTSEHGMWTFGPGGHGWTTSVRQEQGGTNICRHRCYHPGGAEVGLLTRGRFYSGSNLKKLRIRPRANALASTLCLRVRVPEERERTSCLSCYYCQRFHSLNPNDHVIGILSRR